MDPDSLRTASQYVNNLLLARGLLRDGVSIDFAAPAKSGHDGTMASVINLVHDLVLRRDREAEHLTSVSQSFQELRTRATESAKSIARLEAEKADVQRELSTAKSQARQAKAELKTVEAKNKAYKDDIQRLRVSVGQIRAQCANDVRKRDTEITRLKKHIDVRRTRESSRNGPGGVSIIDPTTGKAHYPTLKDGSSPNPGSLRDETNAHLASLSAELTENNEALVHLVQTAVTTLKSLQGQPLTTESTPASAYEPAIHIADTPTLPALSTQLNDTLASLRLLLTNPSFAPVEEVEVREAELVRLRAGWETMEARWKEAVGLMNGWRHRMMGEDAGSISLDDIQRGLDMAEEGLSVAGSPAQRRRRKRDSSGSEVSTEVSMLSNGTVHEEDTPKVKRVRIEGPERGPERGGLFPAPQILKPTCGNRRRSPSPKGFSFEHKDAEATPTPAQRVDMRDDMMSPDIWVEPELTIEEKLKEVQAEAEEATAEEATAEAKPVKRNPVVRKTKTKRRSTLTPAELNGLMGAR